MWNKTFLTPPWGGGPIGFVALNERGLKHLIAVGWKRA